MIAVVLVIVTSLTAILLLSWSFTNPSSDSIHVSGTLQQGVEPGCVVLRSDDGTEYLLLGLSSYPPSGSRVYVTAYVVNGLVSYCMQGEAVRVVSISISAFTTWQFFGYGSQTASTATIISLSNQQSTTVSGVWVRESGFVYLTVESPQCSPECAAPSFILIYLYVPPVAACVTSTGCHSQASLYRLLNADGSPFWVTEPNGTYATVTGILATPSSWNCNSFYIPQICLSGDIYIQNIMYLPHS